MGRQLLRRRRRLASPTAALAGKSQPVLIQAAPASNGQTAAIEDNQVGRLLARVHFTKHSLERFAERAGLPLTPCTDVEMIIRDLVGKEGRVTTEPPTWGRSRNTADLYLQAGDWMLFILRRDRWIPWRYDCVTVVNGPEDNTWENALRRGYIHVSAPGTTL